MDFEFREELGLQACGLEAADGFAVFIKSLLHVAEKVLEDDDVAFHLLYFSDVGDFTRTVLDTGLVNDEIDSRRDLAADGADRQFEAAHEHHGFHTGQHIAGAIRMGSGEGAVVAGIHGLQHVQRFTATDFADDDAVRSHTEGILHQVADGDGAFAFDVRRARFQGHHVGLLKTKFSGVFDGDDTFIAGDEGGKHIQGRGLTGAGTAADEDIELRLDAGFYKFHHILGQRAIGNKIFCSQRRLREFTDGDARSQEGQRRDDDIHAGTVFEAGVHQRRCFIDMAAQWRHNLFDDGHEMSVVVELRLRQRQLAAALHINFLRPIDHDFGDRFIFQERFDGTKPKDFVADIRNQSASFTARHSEWIFFHHLLHVASDDTLHFLTGVATIQDLLLFRRHFIDDAAMNIDF